jgi:MraZ protein
VEQSGHNALRNGIDSGYFDDEESRLADGRMEIERQGAGTVFRGNNPTRIDEKGRLKLPAEFKRQIDESYGTQFFITSRDGKRAEIYPMQEWEKFEAKLAAIPNFNPAKKKLMERINYYGHNGDGYAGTAVDSATDARRVDVTGDVNVFGMHTYFEIANREEFKRKMDAEPLTAEDEESLAAFGLVLGTCENAVLRPPFPFARLRVRVAQDDNDCGVD